MRKFTDNNGRIDVINIQDGHMNDTFKAAIYSFKSDLSGMYLVRDSEKFDLPEKIYGSTLKRSERIKNTFSSREGTTGVLLTGLKGSGKTLLMKQLANECIEDGYPVVTINEAYSGDDFIKFINNLGPCVIVFDEFAKTYRRNGGEQGQETLLTLFDGVATSKKLILLSENSYWDVSDLYKNRPSRIYYSYKYEKLERSLVEEYCADNVDNEDFIPRIIEMSNKTLEFSFDVLQSVIEECNRYPDEDFDSVVADLNISVSENKVKFVITKLESISGKYKGMSYTPALKTIPFDDFYGHVHGVADELLKGDSQHNSIHIDIDMSSFEEILDDGTYVFGDSRVKVEGKLMQPSFSTYGTMRGNFNDTYRERPRPQRVQKTSGYDGPDNSVAEIPFN